MARRWIRSGAIAAVAGVWLAAAAMVGAAGTEVEMRDFAFKPKTVTIAAGDRVTWVNTGDAPHDASGDGWATDVLAAGGSDSVRFTKPGTYDYVCTIHPGLMTGTVVVREPSGGGGGNGGGTAPTTPPTDAAATGAGTTEGPAAWILLGLAALTGLLAARRRQPRTRASVGSAGPETGA